MNNHFDIKNWFLVQGKFLLICLALFLGCYSLFAQQTQQTNPQQARGNFIQEVDIELISEEGQRQATDAELESFYQSFLIKPGTQFDPTLMDLALMRIREEPIVKSVSYGIYENESGESLENGPIRLYILIELQDIDTQVKKPRGILATGKTNDFPLLYQSERAQFKGVLNGALGLFNDENALFGKGEELTHGNPVADYPSGKENRFWLETSLEAGINGITKIKNSPIYLYGEASALVSARNTSDIYSSGADAFLDVERLYAGILIPGLGPKKDLMINASFGRNFFQLNDGFLISRFSGSANAGQRAGVYNSPRTTFRKNGNLSVQWNRFRISGTFLQPEELVKKNRLKTQYWVGSLNYNDNKSWDAGISYIKLAGGKASYQTQNGAIPKKGMYVLNPKLWVTDIGGSFFYIKSEAAWQLHESEDMQSYAWYLGTGYRFKNLKTTPSLYYRYAFMKGDDPHTEKHERFDPMLTGGLGNWVQGLNFRKISGSGNLISHRLEASAWITGTMALSLDYFYLQADQLNNLGSPPPLSQLQHKTIGHEFTLTLKGLVKDRFTLLGITSYAIPGRGMKSAFAPGPSDWFTAQLALFINY